MYIIVESLCCTIDTNIIKGKRKSNWRQLRLKPEEKTENNENTTQYEVKKPLILPYYQILHERSHR